MTFRKYDHVERFGHDEVSGIDVGTVHVFPKLDGTNASVWFHAYGAVLAGSRTRQLGQDQGDNHGFHAWVTGSKLDDFQSLFAVYAGWRVYGEWLVPHTFKGYREDAWRRFWVFDVFDDQTARYVPFEEYTSVLTSRGFDVIEPLCTIINPTLEQLQREVQSNTYLVADGAGAGEGIVLKNYQWYNVHGRQPWAKIVRNEFKEENRRAFGTTEKHGAFQVEAAIAERYVTQALVEKTRAKVRLAVLEEQGVSGAGAESIDATYRSAIIPRLLQTVYYELVREEMWSAVKEHKDPVVDFKKLRRHAVHWTKKYAGDLF